MPPLYAPINGQIRILDAKHRFVDVHFDNADFDGPMSCDSVPNVAGLTFTVGLDSDPLRRNVLFGAMSNLFLACGPDWIVEGQPWVSCASPKYPPAVAVEVLWKKNGNAWGLRYWRAQFDLRKMRVSEGDVLVKMRAFAWVNGPVSVISRLSTPEAPPAPLVSDEVKQDDK